MLCEIEWRMQKDHCHSGKLFSRGVFHNQVEVNTGGSKYCNLFGEANRRARNEPRHVMFSSSVTLVS